MLYYSEYKHSILGTIRLVCEDNKLIGLWLQEQRHFELGLKQKPIRDDNQPILVTAKNWLKKYFNGEKPDISELVLAPNGTNFQKIVWKELLKIPYGQTLSYSDIAKAAAQKLGKERMSAQAVGTAIGHNPIGIIIPCHRVIGKDGKMHGYDAGIDKKFFLLKHENAF